MSKSEHRPFKGNVWDSSSPLSHLDGLPIFTEIENFGQSPSQQWWSMLRSMVWGWEHLLLRRDFAGKIYLLSLNYLIDVWD